MAQTSTTTDAQISKMNARLARIRANKPLSRRDAGIVQAGNDKDGKPLVYSSQGPVAEAVVYDGAFIADLVLAINSSASPLYLQLFDKNNPVAGDVPILPLPVAAGQALSWESSQDGRFFPNAFSFGISTTCFTYTPATAVFWVDVEGRIPNI